MILKALYDLAQRENLVPDPDFEIQPISWVIRVGKGGLCRGVYPLKQSERLPEGSKKKPKMFGKPMFVPSQGGRTSDDRAFFLVDKAEYVLGIDPNSKRDSEKLKSRHDLFVKKVESCWEETKEPKINAVLLFLKALENKGDSDRLFSKFGDCKANDLIAFAYAQDDRYVHDYENVKVYWKDVIKSEVGKNDRRCICLITGKEDMVAKKIPLLKNVPSGTTSGIALISYNSSAFESYGWKEENKKPVMNADISSVGAIRSLTALNRLLHPNPPDPSDLNQTLSRQNIHLSSDTVVCYWTRNKSALSDSFGLALEVDEEKVEAKPVQVAEMYKSIWKGIPYKLDKPDEFYSLVLSGGQGRATVRDWIESNTQHVVDSLAQYFADLRIERCCPSPKKGKQPESFSLPLLLESLADPKDRRKEGIPSAVGTQFYRASIDKKLMFPQPAFSRAILRYRAELGKEGDEKKGWVHKNWNDARAAIIKAYLNRKWRKESKEKEVSEKMNPNCTDKGYLLGQLMGVLEKLQTEALGSVNASIIDRYFAGASASPKSVFGFLLRNARHHARKAKDESKNKGQIFNLERLIDQICSQFDVFLKKTEDPKAVYENGFPAYLSQDQQGMFVLGYHQMRKWLWMTREERDVWNAEHFDAFRAYLWGKKENDLENSTEEKGENQ
ncbi:MAG: type I-C CRISPR-associated protein Cas8c/Csd1 [Pseudomonadota bacterium]